MYIAIKHLHATCVSLIMPLKGYPMLSDILMINVESEDELASIRNMAIHMGRKVPVSIRVNPQIDPKTHPYITTGLKKNKFGVLWDDAYKLYKGMNRDKHLKPVGISSHIGSQILELTPFVDAVR